MSLEVRDTPWWFPFPHPFAPFGRIYLPKKLRERLLRTAPEQLADIIEHEMIHVARQHARGMLRWHLLYALSKRFRWNEEKAAYHASLRRRLARGDRPSDRELDRMAATLSGRLYLWMTDLVTARAFLDAVIAEHDEEVGP